MVSEQDFKIAEQMCDELDKLTDVVTGKESAQSLKPLRNLAKEFKRSKDKHARRVGKKLRKAIDMLMKFEQKGYATDYEWTRCRRLLDSTIPEFERFALGDVIEERSG